MIFKHAVPILYSSDVGRSLDYYTNVLDFEARWDWGNPPAFGGVSRNAVEVFFCREGQGQPGTWLAIMLDDIDEYYDTIRGRRAKIISRPANSEWGLREMLVGDPDGHTIRFGQRMPVPDRLHSRTVLPKTVRIIRRPATPAEKQSLEASLGWYPPAGSNSSQLQPIPFCVHGLVAEDTLSQKVIGCAFLIGDNCGFYYIKDVMVHPAWQGKKVGTAMMHELNEWMEQHAPPNASVWLHAKETLASFYKQFGFVPSFGMFRQIKGATK